MNWNLAAGVAVVTGAGSGIGRALALALAGQGMSTALCDVNSEALRDSTDSVRRCLRSRMRATAHLVDVADARQVARLADEVIAAHGRVTLLVNNAGVALHGRFEELSLEDIDWLMRINFWGVVNGCKIFLPILQKQERAHIANLSSLFGIIAPAGQTAYCASKFAIRGFTEAMRHELAKTTVGVTCVHPGGIQTRIALAARHGEHTRDSPSSFAAAFDHMARHSAEYAAAKIVAGIRKNKARVLIGSEAYALDAIQRIAPAKYWKWIGGQARTKQSNSGS